MSSSNPATFIVFQAKADKSALTSSNPPVPAHTSFTASVNSPGIKPPTSVHGSSTASLVPKQATFATALVSLKVTHVHE